MRNLLTRTGWDETTATVTGCDSGQIIPMRGRGLLLLRPTRFSYYYQVSFVYAAEGRTFTSTFTAYQPYTEGTTFRILYDPHDPQRNSKVDPKGDKTRMLVITAACLAGAVLLLMLKSASQF